MREQSPEYQERRRQERDERDRRLAKLLTTTYGPWRSERQMLRRLCGRLGCSLEAARLSLRRVEEEQR